MLPDGGIARLRVHGDVIPDPRVLDGLTVDLAALENGARVIECSDMFYSSPDNMLFPGLARNQAEGWETARRRDDGHDWAVIRLAAPGVIRLAEIDTTNLKFNAPGAAALGPRRPHGRPRRLAPPPAPHRTPPRHQAPLPPGIARGHARPAGHPPGRRHRPPPPPRRHDPGRAGELAARWDASPNARQTIDHRPSTHYACTVVGW